MTRCSLCEAKIDESMAFCETCGKELDWPRAIDDEQRSPSLEPLSPPNSEESTPLRELEEPVISPVKLRPKKESKPIDVRKLVSYSAIGVLLISIATVFTLSMLAMPSAEKWLDHTNAAFLHEDKATFYEAFAKPVTMIANEQTFYEELASDWPTITAKMQEDIQKGKTYATFQNSEGRDILEMHITKKWGMTDISIRYLPVEVTLVAPKKHQTIQIEGTELFSVHEQEIFKLYAVPGSYNMSVTYKGQTSEQMIILQNNEAHEHVIGDAS